MKETYLVTGGAGFIGANFVHLLMAETDCNVVVLDKLTYAGSLANLETIDDSKRFQFVQGDISDRPLVSALFSTHRPLAVFNFAAESHVDRSIDGPSAFVETNVVGAFVLLDVAREYCDRLDGKLRSRFRFLQVSTDEIYGSLGETGLFSETTPIAPNSPYSASKAAADHFVRAYSHTYGLPTLITNCSNNYGPYQFPEKLIPLMILNALEAKALPIYGDGGNIRDWIYVEDHCRGILQVLRHGKAGERYNLGGHAERTNLEMIDLICNCLERQAPASENPHMRTAGLQDYRDLKRFVTDRPGHDRRYAIDSSKAETELGWKPRCDLAEGMSKTVRWYLGHLPWCAAVQSKGYQRERLGLGAELSNSSH